MSSAKRRGQARGNAPGGSANRGRGGRGPNPARGRVAPFDGPASRGSGSAAGSQSQASAPAAAAASSRRSSSAGSQSGSQPPSQAAAQAAPMARDPAREGPAPRTTDGIKNVDMPASFYNIDGQVSSALLADLVPSQTKKHHLLTLNSILCPPNSQSDLASIRLANRFL